MGHFIKGVALAEVPPESFTDIDVGVLRQLTGDLCFKLRNRLFGFRHDHMISILPDSTIIHSDREYESCAILVTRDEVGESETDLSMIIPFELYPKRVLIRTDECNDCATYCKNKCILYNHYMFGNDCSSLDIHKIGCCPEKEFIARTILHECCKAAKAYLMGDFLSKCELHVIHIPGRNVDEIQAKPVEQKKPELPAGWYSTYLNGKAILRFLYAGTSRKRTIKAKSEEAAEVVLYALADLVAGKESSNKPALSIYKQLTKDQRAREMETYLSDSVASLEGDLKTKDQEIAELQKQLYNARKTIESLQQSSVVVGDITDIQIASGLEPLFPGELQYHVLEVLGDVYKKHYQSADHNYRRAEVLKSIFESNAIPDVYRDLKAKLYGCLIGKDLYNKSTQNNLKHLGFECVQNGDRHFSVYPVGHQELRVTFAATPGDYRSQENAIQDILRKLFN